jgi:hypothetical protein
MSRRGRPSAKAPFNSIHPLSIAQQKNSERVRALTDVIRLGIVCSVIQGATPMAIARARLVDLSVTRWYHCITRYVRGAHLLGSGSLDRKKWIEDRLQFLSQIFAVAVGGFTVMSKEYSEYFARVRRYV